MTEYEQSEKILSVWMAKRGLWRSREHSAKIAHVLELYANGMQINEISKELNISRASVSSYITKYWMYHIGPYKMIIRLMSKV